MAPGLVKYTKSTTVRKIKGRRMNAPRRLHRYRQVKYKSSIYNFKRVAYLENYFSVTSGSLPSASGFFMTLSNLPDISDFQNLFDSYRVNKLVLTIIPKVSDYVAQVPTTLTSVGGANAMMPTIHSAIDYDDSNAPTNFNQMVQYDIYRSTRGHREHTRVWVPKVELTAGATSGLPKSYQWIDTDNIEVPHRGLKVWITPPASLGASLGQATCYFDLKIKAYMSFKHVI